MASCFFSVKKWVKTEVSNLAHKSKTKMSKRKFKM